MNESNYGVPDQRVTIHYVDAPGEPTAIEDMRDADVAAAYDDVALSSLRALQEGRAAGVTRFVFVLPSIVHSGAAGFAATCAASEAVRVLALAAARQWKPDGVTVNCLSVPLPYTDHREEIAPVVAFLASDAGAGVSGVTIPVGGPELGL